MFLDNPEYSKEKTLERCRTYWNPSRTNAWFKMGVDCIPGRREGYYFWDLDGKKFMNLHLNGGTYNLGHRNPEIIETLKEAVEEFDIGNHHFGSVARGYFSEKLVKSTPGMQYAIFSSCGGAANDVAIKSARYATKRRKVVSLDKCFHGHTGLALMAGDNYYSEAFMSDNHQDFVNVPLNDLEAMEEALKDEDVAAVIIESIPATYGFKMPDPGYLSGVKKLCDKYGTLYIADEVQTGLMRTEKLWCVDHEDFRPDIITCGKGLSGGIYPFAATLMTKEAGRWVEEFGRGHTDTFGGSEIGCVVAGKVLDIVTRPSTVENVHFLSSYFKEGLDKVMAHYPDFFTDYTKKGLVMGLRFGHKDAGIYVMRALCRNGIWAIYATFDPEIVQFNPGLLCTKEYVDELMEKFDRSVGEARDEYFRENPAG